ncbi:MAG: hypothetical protein ACHBN1_17520 [Heteroscytonema crispum UTEX LB 1556]
MSEETGFLERVCVSPGFLANNIVPKIFSKATILGFANVNFLTSCTLAPSGRQPAGLLCTFALQPLGHSTRRRSVKGSLKTQASKSWFSIVHAGGLGTRNAATSKCYSEVQVEAIAKLKK